MSRVEVVAQAILFFIVGYETTATTISFLMYNLAMNPDCQDKLYEEINTVLGDKVIHTFVCILYICIYIIMISGFN